MHSPGINGEGELRGQPANPGSPGKMAVKTQYVKQSVLGQSWQWTYEMYRNIQYIHVGNPSFERTVRPTPVNG